MIPAAAIVDTHCHLDFPDFDADRAEILERCRELGIATILIPAVARDNWSRVAELCAGSEMLVAALGLHPVFIDRHRDADLAELDRRLGIDRPRAVGEIGLDFFIRDLDRARQSALCRAQLEIATGHGLPVVLHVRKAHDDMLRLLRETGFHGGGIVHAFNGSIQHAGKYIELGFCLGFGGMMTYSRSRRIRHLAATLPIDSIVLETDAPDMPPESCRGRRNSPEHVVECLRSLGGLRGLAEDQVAAATTRNAARVLGLELR